MDTDKEDGSLQATQNDVNSDEAVVERQSDVVKATYKSFKKKYRKMRIKFDEVMRESNNLVVAEHMAEETAARLARENDRLLELLLDVNNSAQIPADKRIDLSIDTPSLSEIPALVTADELARAAEINTSAGQAIYDEIRKILSERVTEKAASKPPKSLASLMSTIPHLNAHSPNISPELLSSLNPLDGHNEPIAYLTLDAMDDYIYDIDASLGVAAVPPQQPRGSTQLDLALQNPNSVYNWLRRNEPKIFLQDGEGSEKSAGKPGSLRGAGKRASMPVPSKPDALEIVEEDGIGYDPTIGGLEPTKGGKRKRDDDGGYHPKSGTPADGKTRKPRPKKKKIEGEMPVPSSRKKAKPKDRASSPMELDPDMSVEAA